MITANELRQRYLDFFKSKNHVVISSASLIPENDPTVLFNTAGMQPLVPYLSGAKHPSGTRLVDAQKCIRTGDIDEVGDNTHLTFFEMMGNWSLGDYFKHESIEYSWEFLTAQQWLNIPVDKLAVTVFAGEPENNIPRDEESVEIWKSLGVPEHKIAYLGREDNWWGPAGQTGPCGPDTEIFYWVGKGEPVVESNPGSEPNNWVEIWNNVFMEYNKIATGDFELLAQKNVDTGLGLERVVAVLNQYQSVYEVDTLESIYKTVEDLAEDKNNVKNIRIITDHLRAAVMIMGDDKGVGPSNLDQGYVVRRLIRVSIRRAREIGIPAGFTVKVAQTVIDTMQLAYPELESNKIRVLAELKMEEEKFAKVLDSGGKLMEKKFDDYMVKMGKSAMYAQNYVPGMKIDFANPLITPQEAFKLYSEQGIPKELILNFIEKKNYILDVEEFEKVYSEETKKHQDLSRKGAEQKFVGGLADHSIETTRLHTATHLLHAALREILGDHVVQRGSNITKDRLRFDFSHPDKLTDEQKQQVEDWVNDKIQQALPVSFTEMSVEEAKAKKAMGLFTDKYGDKVKIYTVGAADNPTSREICGGPHVQNTSELGKFKIKKEETSSAGIRRIKAVLSEK